MKRFKVLLCGAGELGSRYLQGLKACNSSLEIFVYDPKEKSLMLAKSRWDEISVKDVPHEISFHTSLKKLNSIIDLAIITTTSDVRLNVVNQVLNSTTVNSWILEKVLAQSAEDIKLLLCSLSDCPYVWVNIPRREMNWYQEIRINLDWSSETIFSVSGGNWGLACNSIHFLDLFSWMSGNTIKQINTSHLQTNWFESKRKGFWEVNGSLEAVFSDGSCSYIHSSDTNDRVQIEIRNGLVWNINEDEGIAQRNDGFALMGKVDLQSNITTSIVDSILEKKDCNLPSLAESSQTHKIFLNAMLDHWRENKNSQASILPIT